MLRLRVIAPIVLILVAGTLTFPTTAKASTESFAACVASTPPKVVNDPIKGSSTLTAAQQCAWHLKEPAKGSGDTPKGKASAGSSKKQGPSRAQVIKENEARKARNKELAKKYEESSAGFGRCVKRNATNGLTESRQVRGSCGNNPTPPNFEDLADVPGVSRQGPPDLGLPPETIGFIATTQLQLPQTSIQLGPDPSWNEWDKVFVGYPYWLWMDSETKPLSSSQSVGPVSVGLKARFASVTYQVQGEDAVTCTGSGTPYRRIPSNYGKRSPDCGFQFTSKGSKVITATANWVIEWTVNGQRGTLTLPRTASRAVEVGELQALNVDPPR